MAERRGARWRPGGAELSEARISWLGGPVLRARMLGPFHLHEALRVGPEGLLGEIIQLRGDELIAQVYEDTSGLRPGDLVVGTGQPLTARLGPALIGHIFDGLLRPLDRSNDTFIECGMTLAPAGPFRFAPTVRVGDQLGGGTVFGEVHALGPAQRSLVPPDQSGVVEWIAPDGEYLDDAPICRLRSVDGRTVELSMTHHWSVRTRRPVAARLPASGPLVTGQRILDTLFPVARGGRAALPGGFGTGKTVLQEALAKSCDADVIVYVGCGERGNEMAEVLHEFPQLEDPTSRRPLMERTVIIANTSNMPVAAREASIYTAITVAEYFRDQGRHVALMADSTSRWAEALREVSGRLGELPGEAGFPAYLSSRLADFYERAARVQTLAGSEGSVTIIGAVSPPAGDFSEPVTLHTKRYVRSFWALDRQRAHARFYPAIHPLQSYSEDVEVMAQWWKLNGNPEWLEHRRRILTLLEQQARLERMVRIVGKEALPPAQQLALACADLVNEAMLRQSAMSRVDRYCSPRRQAAIVRTVMRFIELAERALARGVMPERIVALETYRRLQRLGEDIGEDRIALIDPLVRQIESQFESLTPEASDAHDAVH
jgi:V/A-type H+-transporting ATPase subunit A